MNRKVKSSANLNISTSLKKSGSDKTKSSSGIFSRMKGFLKKSSSGNSENNSKIMRTVLSTPLEDNTHSMQILRHAFTTEEKNFGIKNAKLFVDSIKNMTLKDIEKMKDSDVEKLLLSFRILEKSNSIKDFVLDITTGLPVYTVDKKNNTLVDRIHKYLENKSKYIENVMSMPITKIKKLSDDKIQKFTKSLDYTVNHNINCLKDMNISVDMNTKYIVPTNSKTNLLYEKQIEVMDKDMSKSSKNLSDISKMTPLDFNRTNSSINLNTFSNSAMIELEENQPQDVLENLMKHSYSKINLKRRSLNTDNMGNVKDLDIFVKPTSPLKILNSQEFI